MKNAITLLLLANSSLASAQTTLLNGSFEKNNWDKGIEVKTELALADNYVDYDGISASAWNLNKNGILYTKAVNGTSDALYAAEVFNDRGEINQDLVFASAGIYTVNFDTFTAPKESLKFSVSLSGSTSGIQIAPIDVESGNDAAWTNRSQQFKVSDPSQTYTLAFTNLTENTALYVDNVSIKGASPIPEPSSVLLSGIASLLLLRRRR